MTEAYSNVSNIHRYYGKRDKNGQIIQYGSQIPFNFELITKTKYWSTAKDFKTHIDIWLNDMPKGKGIHSNWVVI